MMKYSKNSYNFIPQKDKNSNSSDYDLILKKNRSLIEENKTLLDKLDSLNTQLLKTEELLSKNSEQSLLYSKKISALENKAEKGNKEINDDNYDKKISRETESLKIENESYKKEIASSKEHINTLYLILLVSVIMQDSA
ncbi:MAG: hypothetical protein COA82_04165 [Alkaliphilus sp.]|nr:hypothetical protein [bacterium AH-315-E09]PHS35444.1 MAG: hypothetical protein COA82_04165 [Alkaliphilus sp.]